MERRFRTAGAAVLLMGMGGALAACSDSSPVEPGLDISLVTGTYTMTALRFDPQGSLPDTDILAVIGTAPQLNLTAAGQAQIVYRDPVSTLIVTVPGNFQTTETGVRIDFAGETPYAQLLLSQRMEFVFNEQTRTLTFTATSPDGVSRSRLVALVPALASEQLLDPTPGTLTIAFSRD